MHVRTTGIICAVRAHGETGSIVRVLTRDHGIVAGYVRGGRSRTMRPVLSAGNVVTIDTRTSEINRLPAMTVEPGTSRAVFLTEPLAAAAIAWITALLALALPEGQPYPQLHDGLSAMLDAIAAAPSARGWAGGLVRFERLVLAETGFGHDEGEGPDRLFAALRDNGTRIADSLLTGRRGDALAARDRLIDRLWRALGVDLNASETARDVP